MLRILAEWVNLIVDALLGTGLRQAPRESISQLIDHANSHPAPIVAVDIPSACWLNWRYAGGVINANHTITFIALKPGLLTGKARDVTGQLHFDSLGLDSWLAGRDENSAVFGRTTSHWLNRVARLA
ncbi:NAD(P)H-hydrate epimerase [Shigella flexneri]